MINSKQTNKTSFLPSIQSHFHQFEEFESNENNRLDELPLKIKKTSKNFLKKDIKDIINDTEEGNSLGSNTMLYPKRESFVDEDYLNNTNKLLTQRKSKSKSRKHLKLKLKLDRFNNGNTDDHDC